MGNEVGRLLWARLENGSATILGNPPELLVSCWRSPWCRWLDEDTFVFKTQYVDRGRARTPLVVIHVRHGFTVVSGIDAAEVWLDREIPHDLRFEGVSGQALRSALEHAT